MERHDPDATRHRDEARATDTIRGQLDARGVELDGRESPMHLADLLAAVEVFERAVAARGGDSMTNAPDSRHPDDYRLVLPKRSNDETVAEYTRRILSAADRVAPRP